MQGFDVTLLEAGAQPGGLVAGWQTPGGRSVEVGIHGKHVFFISSLADMCEDSTKIQFIIATRIAA